MGSASKLVRALACAVWVVGCASRAEPVATEVGGAREGPPSARFTRACPDLPEARPDDLVVRFELHDYEAPENLARWTIAADGDPCPADDMPPHLLRAYAAHRCVSLAGAEYDALYATLRRRGVDRIRTRPMEPAPHRGGTAILLRWGSASCRVADIVHDTEVDPRDADAYRAADGAIRDAVRAALGQTE